MNAPITLMPIARVAERLQASEHVAVVTMRRVGLLINMGTRRRPLYYVVVSEFEAWLAARVAESRPPAPTPIPRHLRPVRKTA